jgi:hypothetical protein
MARSATTGLDTYYGDEPWSAWDINQRSWYVPLLQRAYRQRSNFGQMVPIKVDFTAQRTGTIIWTGIYDLEPSIDSIGLRDIWLASNHTDGWQMRINMAHYGDKLALHKYDPLVTFFTSGGGAGNLAALSRELLGNAIIDTMETQIRNAFLQMPMVFIQGGGTGFSAIGDTDILDPDLAMDVQLNFAYHEVVDPNSPGGLSAVAYSSPGVIHGIQDNDTWVSRHQYSETGFRTLMRYEVGAWKGLRYINHPRNTLYNCGEITAQAPVTVAISAGDGAPDPGSDGSGTKVLGTYEVGQKAGSQTHYITLGTFSTGSISDLAVGDIVSIHTRKADGGTPPYDVVGAPYPTDGTKIERQIVDISGSNLLFDKPIMQDYDTEAANDCSAGEYAFVTKGRHIHATIVVAAPGGVVGGFAQPPQLHTPPPVDDLESLWRFSWDGYYNYSRFRTEVAAVIFSAGYVSKMGYKKLGS